ncbi:hypothetical protein ATERTT37_007587 [Aspergillus terreus]
MHITWRDSADPVVYEEARVGRVFNHRRPKRYPIAVVKATCVKDIIAAVKLAKERKCRVAVRSGGHSWAAWSVRDESILIDLGNYKEWTVDAGNRVVQATPSVTGRELNSMLTEQHGLMFPGGHCFPAVVTKYHLDLIPYHKDGIRSSGYFYPLSKYHEAFNWIVGITPSFDQDTEIVAVGLYPEGSDEIHLFILFVTLKQTAEEAHAALAPAHKSRPQGAVNEWFCKEDSLANQYLSQKKANPEGHRYCVDNGYIHNNADVPKVLEEAFTTLPHRKAFALWYAMNPTSRRDLPDMAVSVHSDHYFALYTVWEDEKDDERCQGWVKDVMTRVHPHAVGAYLGDSDFQERQTKYWAESNAERLRDIRNKWDPTGRICGYLDKGDVSGTRGLENVHIV